jgi:phosphatidylglycerol lysyltransferase
VDCQDVAEGEAAVTDTSGREHPRIDAASSWIVAHAARLWGFALFGIVLALSWQTLREVHTREVREVLRALHARELTIAAAVTIVNIAIMGLYDVMAFRHTRTRAIERWRFGAVAFCWSNFLTLGPVAGPAIRLWLYRRRVTDLSELHPGIVSVVIAFTSGLAGWTLAALIAPRIGGGMVTLAALALAFVIAAAWTGRSIAQRTERFAGPAAGRARTLELALVGWLDWFFAAIVFLCCLYATGRTAPILSLVDGFFFGQVIGLASLVPGGFGSSDAFWIARLPFDRSVTAAALGAYRFIYYIAPWFTASMVLLSWATRASSRRVDVARRITASLVGGGGVLMILSSASPALHARLVLLEEHVPLPLVEAGQLAASLAGLLLLVLARGLARGYRSAFKLTLALLLLAGLASLLKGLDWEEALVLGTIGIAAWSQAALFDRASAGDWLEWADLGLAFAALLLFVVFGTFSHHIGAAALERWTSIGYHLQTARFVRTAASMLLAVTAGALYVIMRTPVRFERPDEEDIRRALQVHETCGTGTTPLMVAVGDKSVFFDGTRGFCLYRTIGPYLTVFSDPVVRSPAERAAFMDALFGFAANLDRRPMFYQISVEWIPLLHDRGYHLFKLGEEAIVHLDRLTLDGHVGKMNRQILRRAERDGVTFRIMQPEEIDRRMTELQEISDGWLRAKGVVERQFSIGFFDSAYMRRFPCAVAETATEPRRLLAFANLLEGPGKNELSVDLMRYRTDGPTVMDFLLLSVMLHGKNAGYRRFNLGMAPLASVGEHRRARVGERLAGLLFRRGEQWYNFQGVRFYKQKFDPEWVPRYMAYQSAVEWPVALAHVSALIAGSWGSALLPGREGADEDPEHRLATVGRA